MSIHRLRQILTYLVVILVTLIAVLALQQFQRQRGLHHVATQITQLCEFPELPEELTIRHASIDRSQDPQFVDIILALTGPTETLDAWLEKMDLWEKKRPGVIQNHRIREAEMSSRVDLSAEVYLK